MELDAEVVVVVVEVGSEVVVILLVVELVELEVDVVGGVLLLLVVTVTELVAGAMWVVVEAAWQSRAARSDRVLAPWRRLACKVPLTLDGRAATASVNLCTAPLAAAQSPERTAASTLASWPLSESAWWPESRPALLPQAASESAATPIRPATIARGARPIRSLTLETAPGASVRPLLAEGQSLGERVGKPSRADRRGRCVGVVLGAAVVRPRVLAVEIEL